MKTKPITVLAVGLAVVAIGAIGLALRPASPKSLALTTREKIMASLGSTVAKLHPQCKVLVLANPFSKISGYLDQNNQFDRANLRGLRKGLGEHIPVTVVLPEIRPEYFTNRQAIVFPPDCRTPLSFAIVPASVDQLADAHPECQVIVSLIGLPDGVDQLKIWGEKDPRTFALLLPDLRVLGPPSSAVEAFQRGKLLATVAEDEKSSEPLVVTRDNVEEVLGRQPRALGY